MLVAARPPLVAFNVELAPPATLEDARAIARSIREGGPEGLDGVRAIGLWLAARDVAQVSTNVEDHRATPLAEVVEAIARHATPSQAELVGLAPRAAFDGFPADLPVADRRRSRTRSRYAATAPRKLRLLSCIMAQTKRKRRTKHRGTAAGTIEARGRTGRPPTADERKKQSRRRRARSG